jgi:hypothetical protein
MWNYCLSETCTAVQAHRYEAATVGQCRQIQGRQSISMALMELSMYLC